MALTGDNDKERNYTPILRLLPTTLTLLTDSRKYYTHIFIFNYTELSAQSHRVRHLIVLLKFTVNA